MFETNLELLEYLNGLTQQQLLEELDHIHPVDLLELINDDSLDFDREALLNRLPVELIAELIDEEEQEDKYELLSKVQKNKQSEVVEEMASDELVDMLSTIEDDQQKEEILEMMDDEDAKEVRQLLTYDEEVAGGIMATEYISIYEDKTVARVLRYLREIKEEVENPYALYVVDPKTNELLGVFSLSELVTAELDEKVTDMMNPNVITINHMMHQEDVAREFSKYNFLVMPVVDDNNILLGVITIDDIVEIIEEEATADMLQMGGVNEDETVDSSVVETVKSRLPWLFINLFTAVLASVIIDMFSQSISQVVILASLMPIVTGMGGNAGTQTLTLITRSIALGDLDETNSKSTLLKELFAGFINGIAIGLLTGIIGFVMGGKFAIGVIVAIAMLLNMIVAVLAGFFIPYILNKMNIDPAIASSVFVTTFTDCCGFLFFLGLATQFMNFLL